MSSLIASTGASNGLKNLPTLLRAEEQAQTVTVPASPHKKRGFSAESLNDLLFWGFHLFVIAVALALVLQKIHKLSAGVGRPVKSENKQLRGDRQQADAATVFGIRRGQGERGRAMKVHGR